MTQVRHEGARPETAELHHALPLSDPRAANVVVAGAKGANLARALTAGLPVLPGYILPTDAPSTSELGAELAVVREALAPHSLIVRSSSTIEDVGASSMAGQFRSVLDVTSQSELVAAVETVRRSASRPDLAAAPMAVLIQPQLEPLVSGVMFGMDPVTGVEGRLVVEAVSGGPDRLVSGQVTAERISLNLKGRVVAVDGVPVRRGSRHRGLLDRGQCRALSRLAGDLERAYGAPQDVEWAVDPRGRLVLLQTRPVTTRAARVAGPVLGPGPVAETFPFPLRPLECDLWLTPMRAGISTALARVGVVPRRTLSESPVVLAVQGWAAVDLELFGYLDRRPHGWHWIDPRPPARRLGAAWRIGTLRARLTDDASALMARSDELLASVPAPSEMSEDQFPPLLDALRALLVDLHTHEVLAAALTGRQSGSLGAAALDALSRGRAVGLSDPAVVHHDPVVLALVPPRVGTPMRLPDPAPSPPAAPPAPPGLRELLRLRVRWVQELQARMCVEIGHRLAALGRLPSADSAAWLRLDELPPLLLGGPAPDDLSHRMTVRPGPPLPTHFQLGDDGTAVPVERRGARPHGGVGAGGGRGVGTVVHADAVEPNSQADESSQGRVLVVRTLDPTLAARLPGLSGLVSESGSTLSHLAILAREYQVPTVVAVHDALHRFPVGERVVVDGRTGEVSSVSSEVTS
jgi:rifampicin phosphotransferase